jgi:hypothetical protein
MIVYFIGQGLKLQSYFTDLSQKGRLYFISTVGNCWSIIDFGLFEYFIVLSIFIEVLLGWLFGFLFLEIMRPIVFFILTCGLNMLGIYIRMEGVGNDFDADVD